jgi:metal-sulfur cluster biosynthetic enzyme
MMKKKLQAVLERVKDRETNQAISELGLVESFLTIRSKRNSPF